MKKQHVWALCKYGLGLDLLAYVLWQYWQPGDGTPGLADALQKDIHVAPLLLALVINLAGLLITFARWYVLVRAQDLPFTPNNALRLGLIGYTLSTFLPGSVGGDLIKAAFIAREQSRRTVAVATVVVDRLVGLCGLFWLVALLGGIFQATGALQHMAQTPQAVAGLETIVWASWLLSGGSILFWLLLGILPDSRAVRFAGRLECIPKVGGSFAELWRAAWMYRCRGGSILLSVLMSMVGHVAFVLTFYCAALSLCPADAIPSLGAQFLLVPVGMTIQAGFPAPGGVGGGEWGFGALYRMAGSTFANGVLASLVQRVLCWALALAGYLVYLRMGTGLPRVQEEPAPELAVAEA